MRVRYGEHSSNERRLLADLDARIDEFFTEVAERGGDARFVRETVERRFSGLTGEVIRGGYVVRARTRALVPIAERIAERAPPGLSVLSRRPPVAFEEAISTAKKQRALIHKSQVRAGFSRGHLLEIIVSVPGGSGGDAEQALVESLVFDLLGEKRADDWIGAVLVTPAPRGGPLRVLGDSQAAPEARFDLRELPACVDAAVGGLYAELPQEPYFSREISGEWTLFELEPESEDDFTEQNDLVLATTCVPELLKCYLERAPFSSVRFSRHGELFVHLKYRADGSPEARLSRRLELEDLLDRALVGARAGRVVGAGLGLRYTYVNLALAQAKEGMNVACEIGRQFKLPRAAWLQPFDTDLSAEWVEVWPGASPPPGVSA